MTRSELFFPACPDGLILWDIQDPLDWIPVPVLNRTIRLYHEVTTLHQTMYRVHTWLARMTMSISVRSPFKGKTSPPYFALFQRPCY